MSGRDFLHIPWVHRLVCSRWPQLLVTLVLLTGFLLAIVAGLAGSPVANRNFAIVGVWIAWWAALMLVVVPLVGRGWCGVCPLGAPGDWLQRGAVLTPRDRPLGLGRRWPVRLRNLWLQNAAFLALAVASAAILTQARLTGLVLAVLLLVALGVSLVFERRAFCRFLCPVGGFVGLYSQLAPLALRIRDKRRCAAHRTKTCYIGCDTGSGCPWGVYPGALHRNPPCGLCLECVRTCPHDNIALVWRGARNDLVTHPGRRLDEAFKALIMLGSALVYAAVFLGPWAELKTAALGIGSPRWFGYAAGVVLFLVGVLPMSFLVVVEVGRRLARSPLAPGRAFAGYAAALVPLGLAAWIAFTLALVFANGSYVLAVLSDPFGWGWDLFGTAATTWRPVFTRLLPALQAAVLVLGVGISAATARRIAEVDAGTHALRQTVPVVVYGLLVTGAMLRVLIG